MDLDAFVTQDIADLVPEFLENRRREINALSVAISKADFDRIYYLACRMYGVGNPFGFRQVTTFGRQLRDSCFEEDVEAAKKIVRDYQNYLQEVNITVVATPPKRPQWQDRAEADRRRLLSDVGEERRKTQRRKAVAPRRRAGHEEARINADQDHDLRYWSERLGVSREKLRQAVQAAGPMVKDVQRHLGR